MKETCETCNGTGLVAKTIHTDNGDFDADDQTCQECGGHGIIHFPNEERLSEQCQACESTGRAKQEGKVVRESERERVIQLCLSGDGIKQDSRLNEIYHLLNQSPPETESQEELFGEMSRCYNVLGWGAVEKQFTIHRKQ